MKITKEEMNKIIKLAKKRRTEEILKDVGEIKIVPPFKIIPLKYDRDFIKLKKKWSKK